MDNNKQGGYDEVLALDTASEAAPESPTVETTQNIQPDNAEPTNNPEEKGLSADPQKSEPKSESDPDEELLKVLEEFKGDIPIGKIERVRELVRQKNDWKQKYEGALKTTVTPSGQPQNEAATKPTTQDVSKYSDDFEELLTQIDPPVFEPLFEYTKDESGNITGYKDETKMPKTVDDMLKAMYPVIEKNILKRVGQASMIRESKKSELQKAEENSTSQLKQDIKESFVDDNEGYDAYQKVLGEDFDDFKSRYPDRPFDVRAHHEFYMRHSYGKDAKVSQNNLETAKKISRSSAKADPAPRDAGSINIDDIVNL